jgi:hypothetical protein
MGYRIASSEITVPVSVDAVEYERVVTIETNDLASLLHGLQTAREAVNATGATPHEATFAGRRDGDGLLEITVRWTVTP